MSVFEGAICNSGMSSPLAGRRYWMRLWWRELGELFDADAGVAKHLDHRPGPKGPVLLEGQVAPASALRIFAPDAARSSSSSAPGDGASRPPR